MSDQLAPGYGYFGPRGTFTQAALASYLGSDADDAVPYPTVPAALDAVAAGAVGQVMVPIENSVEGVVSATLDALNAREGLLIRAEVLVPITFVLAVRPGTALADVHAGQGASLVVGGDGRGERRCCGGC